TSCTITKRRLDTCHISHPSPPVRWAASDGCITFSPQHCPSVLVRLGCAICLQNLIFLGCSLHATGRLFIDRPSVYWALTSVEWYWLLIISGLKIRYCF